AGVLRRQPGRGVRPRPGHLRRERARDHRQHAGQRIPRGGRAVRAWRGELPPGLDLPPRRPQPVGPPALGDDGDLHGPRHAPARAGQPHAGRGLGEMVPRRARGRDHRHAEEPGAVRVGAGVSGGRWLAGFALALCLAACGGQPGADPSVNEVREAAVAERAPAGEEVFYHVFQRSFRDGSGDGVGDLAGLTEKLDYLADLGVTSLLLTPLQPSPFYHGYFPTDFEAIDPAYGTREDYIAFVRAAHARGLKVYLDQEIQYVGEGHPWWTRALADPQAPEAEFLMWKDRAAGEAEPFLDRARWEHYDGTPIG